MRDDVTLPPERAIAARAGGFWRDRTVLDDLERNLANNPDRVAVTGFNTMTGERKQLTTRQLNDYARRVAAGLARRGIERGDIVSAQLPNWWQMIALHLALLRLGAVINPLMPIFRERELSFMLSLAESKAIVVPQRFRGCDHAGMLRGLQPVLPHLRHVLVIGAERPDSFDEMLAEDPGDIDALTRERRATPDDVIEVLYTSGTTGEPKGVLHTSNTLSANLDRHIQIWGLGQADVTLMSSPVAHQTGFQWGVMGAIMAGGRVVLQDIWNPTEAVDLIEREGVTFSIGSTPFLADLLEAAKGRPAALRTLRTFGAAGAPIPRHLVSRAAEDFDVIVHSVWGMTEIGPATFTGPDDPLSRALETDGRPAPGMELRVADENGRALPFGAAGRLLVRGAGMFVGYLKRPQLYVTDAEGWFDTGDLARMDPAGYVRITGRSKDVIIRGGENIPVIEIENLIYQHPAVSEVAIVAMPDPRLGERGCAFAVLRPGNRLTLGELSQYMLSHRCTKNYLPERLEIVDALPRTPSGKIQKFVLRQRAHDFGPDA